MFEFQLCVVDTVEYPVWLCVHSIAGSEGASASGNAAVTTKSWWLPKGLRGFDKSGCLQVPENWY